MVRLQLDLEEQNFRVCVRRSIPKIKGTNYRMTKDASMGAMPVEWVNSKPNASSAVMFTIF